MSELINNSAKRKELLKHLILQLHNNEAPEVVKKRLIEVLRSIPYDEVVEVEQELIAEGLPEEEILRLCDIHTAVLDGSIDVSGAKQVSAGHPVHTFKEENKALGQCIAQLKELFYKGNKLSEDEVSDYVIQLKGIFNSLSDVDKHYKRKEFLLFPFLEKAGITGPPKVMWGKHDETRAFLTSAHEALSTSDSLSVTELPALIINTLVPAMEAVEGMIIKEESILLPMSLDTLKEEDWYEIYRNTLEFGFCLYDPQTEWKPKSVEATEPTYIEGDAIRLSSGSFSTKELEALFVNLPIDITFVDKDDKVKFFSHSPKRVFERNRSIIGRNVSLCHPPGSVHIVEKILDDFRSGRENKAAFWISSFKGRFVYIEYTALRSPEGEYLGVVEVTQDITELRQLEGDQRLLSYSEK